MSHNVTWRTRVIEHLTLPLACLPTEDTVVDPSGDTHVDLGCEFGIMSGYVVADQLRVTAIDYGGEFSGTSFNRLLDLLRESKGYLAARIVWEDGSVEMLVIQDGDVRITELKC